MQKPERQQLDCQGGTARVLPGVLTGYIPIVQGDDQSG
jgi:hypothetical protein